MYTVLHATMVPIIKFQPLLAIQLVLVLNMPIPGTIVVIIVMLPVPHVMGQHLIPVHHVLPHICLPTQLEATVSQHVQQLDIYLLVLNVRLVIQLVVLVTVYRLLIVLTVLSTTISTVDIAVMSVRMVPTPTQPHGSV